MVFPAIGTKNLTHLPFAGQGFPGRLIATVGALSQKCDLVDSILTS
jgi:hypothetical protein